MAALDQLDRRETGKNPLTILNLISTFFQIDPYMSPNAIFRPINRFTALEAREPLTVVGVYVTIVIIKILHQQVFGG